MISYFRYKQGAKNAGISFYWVSYGGAKVTRVTRHNVHIAAAFLHVLHTISFMDIMYPVNLSHGCIMIQTDLSVGTLCSALLNLDTFVSIPRQLTK